MIHVCRVLILMHHGGKMHRDLKPDNILVSTKQGHIITGVVSFLYILRILRNFNNDLKFWICPNFFTKMAKILNRLDNIYKKMSKLEKMAKILTKNGKNF